MIQQLTHIKSLFPSLSLPLPSSSPSLIPTLHLLNDLLQELIPLIQGGTTSGVGVESTQQLQHSIKLLMDQIDVPKISLHLADLSYTDTDLSPSLLQLFPTTLPIPLNNTISSHQQQQQFITGQCTYFTTGKSFVMQAGYHCYTCQLTGEKAVCSACVQVSHR